MPTLTIEQDKRKKWRWQLKARNGEIIGASTQGYSSKSDCEDNIVDIVETLVEITLDKTSSKE